MDINMISIGNRIKKRRLELNLTQTDIYHKCGIASGALSQIENGSRTPSVITFYILARALNCDMEWLVTGTTTNKNDFVIYESEEKLLNDYRQLSEEDKEEFMGILQLKLQKTQKAREANLKSPQLTDIAKTNLVG